MKLISTNPSSGYAPLGEVETSTAEDVARAVARARTAQPLWAALPLAARCELITSLIEVSRGRAEQIARLITAETGRPIASARSNVLGGIDYLTAYVAMAEECLAPRITVQTDSAIHRVHREPWGIVACICPWNYPFLNVAWQCGQALIAGNAIVYKNSEENPLFTELLAEVFASSELPPGVFNVLYGDATVGGELARAGVDMISFTGSTAAGRALTRVAAGMFIPIVTELGGSDPCVVFEDVDPAAVAGFIYNQRFANAGQLCDATKRLIVHRNLFEPLTARLAEVIRSKRVGDAADDDTDVGPLISRRQLERLESQVQDAVDRGAEATIGGARPPGLSGAYYLPTLLTRVSSEMRVWQEEVFGPVLPVVPFTTEDEAVALANDSAYGLGAAVLTDDTERFLRVARRLKSGVVAHNQAGYLHPRSPFGGYKKSGMGRVHGAYGFEEVTQVKLVSEARPRPRG